MQQLTYKTNFKTCLLILVFVETTSSTTSSRCFPAMTFPAGYMTTILTNQN